MELDDLKTMNQGELLETWTAQFRKRPPPVRSAEFLRNLLAWKLQERLLGGLSPKKRRRLRQLADTLEKNPDHRPRMPWALKSGTVLTREWQGIRHAVMVCPDGFEYAGKRYRSLTGVARTITGTRWSGSVFFGLRKSRERRTG